MELFITDETQDEKVLHLPDLHHGIYLANVGSSRTECLITVYCGRATAFATKDPTDLRAWSQIEGDWVNDWKTTELRNVREVRIDGLDIAITRHIK